jgi:chromosome segregation ATPase
MEVEDHRDFHDLVDLTKSTSAASSLTEEQEQKLQEVRNALYEHVNILSSVNTQSIEELYECVNGVNISKLLTCEEPDPNKPIVLDGLLGSLEPFSKDRQDQIGTLFENLKQLSVEIPEIEDKDIIITHCDKIINEHISIMQLNSRIETDTQRKVIKLKDPEIYNVEYLNERVLGLFKDLDTPFKKSEICRQQCRNLKKNLRDNDTIDTAKKLKNFKKQSESLGKDIELSINEIDSIKKKIVELQSGYDENIKTYNDIIEDRFNNHFIKEYHENKDKIDSLKESKIQLITKNLTVDKYSLEIKGAGGFDMEKNSGGENSLLRAVLVFSLCSCTRSPILMMDENNQRLDQNCETILYSLYYRTALKIKKGLQEQNKTIGNNQLFMFAPLLSTNFTDLEDNIQ